MIERCLKLLPIDYAGELDDEQFQTILSHAKKMVFEAKQVIINKGNIWNAINAFIHYFSLKKK